MSKFAVAACALLSVSACGTQLGDRMVSGAAIGGGAGLVAGGLGAIPGAMIGAGVGALTPPEQVNLGEPVWDDPAWTQSDDPAQRAPAETPEPNTDPDDAYREDTSPT